DEISSFRTSPGGIFFSVIGGRVSEGMDFPGDTLELAILVGIPYPKPTARQKGLRRYYDIKTGNGWLFAVLAPTVRKILQAMGRLIRSEEDRGVAVIMDVRAKRFQEYIDGLEMEEDVAGRVRKFFSSVVTESD
ncbi:MAG: helicase C-terminal domain-containing protein, partial [Candidatus Thermoplasmatota archaeon]|nr:helicase C-terminal domain-containing protein [Candidatus Thermoplasmatota archaeon]